MVKISVHLSNMGVSECRERT